MAKYCEKWWGWGEIGKTFPRSTLQKILKLLPKDWIKNCDTHFRNENAIDLPDIKLALGDQNKLKEIVGEKNFFTDKKTRLCHSFGKSYTDLIQANENKITHAPDAVLFPENEVIVHEIIAYAHFQNICVVPFGGGTSVLGGVNPLSKEQDIPVMTLNLRNMNKVLNIDEKSRFVHAQAGILGPELERELNLKGFTLGHFPQSFEFSTLGGWIATRSAGHSSNYYGRIEDLLLSLKVATIHGLLETKPHPASSCGPNWNEVYLGSEGTFGIICDAYLKIQKLPESKTYMSFLLPLFQDGVRILRRLKDSSLSPSVVRLSDSDETRFMLEMQNVSPQGSQSDFVIPSHSGKKSIFISFLKNIYLSLGRKLKKISPSENCFLILGLEGSSEEVSVLKSKIKDLCYKGLSLGASPGYKWEKNYFLSAYLRDELIIRGVLIDTLETVTSWARLSQLYEATYKALKNALGHDSIVMCHISHIYETGASLYFTFLSKASSDPISQWQHMKEGVTQTILKNHGALSHHHGIGIDHKKWIYEEKGSTTMEEMKALKKFSDPKNILNSGKLF